MTTKEGAIRHDDKNGKTTIILLAAVLLVVGSLALLTGCTDDEPTVSQSRELRFDIQGERLMGTRATIVTDDADLQAEEITINALFHGANNYLLGDATLLYDTDRWRFDDGSGTEVHYYWPIDGSVYKPSPYPDVDYSSLDFIGFWPKTGNIYNYARPIITPLTHILTLDVGNVIGIAPLPVTDAGQEDLTEFLFAFLPGQTYTDQVDAGGALPLRFKHPFALIKFVINAASGTNVQINSISLDGMKTSGVCTYDGSTMTWSGLSGSETMTIAQTLKVGETTETTPLLVIPNNYGSKFLTVNATWDDWSNPVTISDYGTNVNFNWEPGHIYTYNLTLDKYGLKVDTEKFTEQW